MTGLRLAAALAAALALAACEPVPPVNPAGVERASAAPAVGDRINRARVAAGLPPLAPSPALDDAAIAQAEYVASLGRLTHRSPRRATVKGRIEARGYDACLAAENLAAGQTDAAAVTAGWLSSPGHRANILLPGATHYGAGWAVTTDGTPYWTLVLARPC